MKGEYRQITPLARFVKNCRKKGNLTQADLAVKAGVGIRFVRDLEQGKPSLRLDTVNKLLAVFDAEMEPTFRNNSGIISNHNAG